MAEIAPHLGEVGQIAPAEWTDFGATGAMDPAPFATPINNYYMTDPISRASETMAKCTSSFVTAQRPDAATGT